MSERSSLLSRRTFLSRLGLAAATIPWLPQTIMAQEAGRPDAGQQKLHRILTCNIRVALPKDEEKGYGWNARREICSEVMHVHQPDIICLQEVIRVQMEDLKKYFPGFDSFGFEGPVMDAYPEGYHWVAKNPIMFSGARYELTAAGSYWLSETPLIAGSKSWGTARARQANWVRLKDRHTGREFRVVNTHLDHIAQNAREKQTGLVMKECAQYLADFPQVLTGDFNVHMPNPVFDIIRAGGWTDSYAAVHGNTNPGFTYHGFRGAAYVPKQQGNNKIDFIFTKGAAKAEQAAIIRDSRNGRYPSDHYFVSADINL